MKDKCGPSPTIITTMTSAQKLVAQYDRRSPPPPVHSFDDPDANIEVDDDDHFYDLNTMQAQNAFDEPPDEVQYAHQEPPPDKTINIFEDRPRICRKQTANRRVNDLQQFEDRRKCLVLTVEEGGKVGFFNARCGGPMGDSNEPLAFMLNYHRAIIDYLGKTEDTSEKLRTLHPFISDWEIDLSICTFIDDLLRIIVLDDAKDATSKTNKDSEHLTECLEKLQYKQNANKAEIIANLVSHSLYRKFRKDEEVTGKVLPDMKYLGGFVSAKNSNHTERAARIAAANMNWSNMYSFFTSNAGWKAKRLQFVTLIISAIVSGTETVNYKPTDFRTFDCVVLKKMRSMLWERAQL